MHFLLFYETIPDYLEKRQPHRSAHFDYLKKSKAAGHLKMGGAYANPSNGAALVFECDVIEIVQQFAKNDPYVRNGLIKKWEVREWTVVDI
ncbi:MAG: YciI-like protein [Saprospiraceae bacterium]